MLLHLISSHHAYMYVCMYVYYIYIGPGVPNPKWAFLTRDEYLKPNRGA